MCRHRRQRVKCEICVTVTVRIFLGHRRRFFIAFNALHLFVFRSHPKNTSCSCDNIGTDVSCSFWRSNATFSSSKHQLLFPRRRHSLSRWSGVAECW